MIARWGRWQMEPTVLVLDPQKVVVVSSFWFWDPKFWSRGGSEEVENSSTGCFKKKLGTVGCRVILLMEFPKSAEFLLKHPLL